MDKNLRKESLKVYSKNKLVAWVLSFFVALFIALVSMLGVFIPYLGILLIPVLILPIIFASQAAYVDTYNGSQLTFRSFFTFFISFFRGGNSGTYSFIRSFFKSLLGFMIVYSLSSFIGAIILFSTNREGVMQMLQIAQDIIMTDTYVGKTVAEAFGEYYYLLEIFQNIVLIPSTITFVGLLLFFISRNSVSMFLRMHFPNGYNAIYRDIFNTMVRMNRKQFHKDFFYLNWPMFVIFLVMSGASVGVSFIFTGDSYLIIPISVSIGLFSLVFFLPFFFANQMSLFTKYHEEFKKSSDIVQSRIYNELQRRIQEDKELEEQLQKMMDEVSRLKAEEEKKNLEENQDENKDNQEDEK